MYDRHEGRSGYPGQAHPSLRERIGSPRDVFDHAKFADDVACAEDREHKAFTPPISGADSHMPLAPQYGEDRIRLVALGDQPGPAGRLQCGACAPETLQCCLRQTPEDDNAGKRVQDRVIPSWNHADSCVSRLIELLHSNRLRQIPGLIDIGALEDGHVIRQQLNGDGVE